MQTQPTFKSLAERCEGELLEVEEMFCDLANREIQRAIQNESAAIKAKRPDLARLASQYAESVADSVDEYFFGVVPRRRRRRRTT